MKGKEMADSINIREAIEELDTIASNIELSFEVVKTDLEEHSKYSREYESQINDQIKRLVDLQNKLEAN